MRTDGTLDEEKAATFFGKDDAKEKEIFFAVLNTCRKGKKPLHLKIIHRI